MAVFCNSLYANIEKKHQGRRCIFAAMGLKKIFLLATTLLLILSLFFPWVIIESRDIVVSGMQAAGTTYGKPGLLSLLLSVLVAIFGLVPRIWAHRICIFSSAVNTGWALRNFLLLSVCQGGECPERQLFFYVYLCTSILLLAAVLVQEVPYKRQEPDTNVA